MALGRIRSWAGATLVVAMATGLAWSFAPDSKSPGIEKLLPAGSVLMVSLDGGLQHKAAFEKTAAYEALYTSGLVDGLKKALERIRTQAQSAGADEKVMATIANVATHVCDNGVGFGLSIEPNTEGPPKVVAVAVLTEGAQFFDELDKALKAAINEGGKAEVETGTKHGRQVSSVVVPDSPGVDIGWWKEGNHLVLAAGINGVESALSIADGSAPNVTTNALYKKYSTSKNFEQTGIAYLDFAALRTTFGGLPLPPLPNGEQITVNDILKILGLTNLNAAVTQSGIKDRALWSESTVEAPGSRSGLLALMDQPGFTLKDLPPLPPKLLSLTSAQVNGKSLYDTIYQVGMGFAKLSQPDIEAQFQQNLAQAEQHLGFKVKDDLIALFNGPACVFADGGGAQFEAVGAAVKVSDGDKLGTTLQKIFDLVSQESRGEVVFEKSTKAGRTLHVMRIRQFGLISPTICIDKGWMHIAAMPQAIEASLLRADGKLQSWKPTEDYAAALKEMPEKFTGLSISDTQTTYRNLLSAAPMLIGLAKSALAQQQNVQFEFPLEPEDLPPAELVAQGLFPNVTVGYSDANGFKQLSRNSMPGLEIGASVGVAAVGMALLLPAVQQAREAARRTQSNNNLKQMGLALHNYHDVFGQFPPGTHLNEKLDPDERLSWMSEILAFIDQAPLYDRLDRDDEWNKGKNEAVSQTVIPTYLHPSVSHVDTSEGAVTHYVGLAGVGEDGPKLDAKNPKAGFFGYNRATKISQITDGTSNTVAVSESDGESRPWMRGGPSTIRPLTESPYIGGSDGIGGISPLGANMLFGDGSVRFISQNIDDKVMEALVTIAGGEVIDSNDF
jgi:prepilin-type processing-associated H-X9-DG protein